MRVIAGRAKGRRLKAVPGMATRPTADRVKEALFSMLSSRFDLNGTRLLDLFAGTGALGIEALSRGALSVVFVESEHGARRVLEENLAACGFDAAATVLALPVQRAVQALAQRGARFDGGFMDPPYGHGLAHAALEQLGAGSLLEPGAWVAVEHHCDDPLAQTYAALQLTAQRRYGKTGVALYCNAHVVES
jgi:16S rRNA (guanine966-N2)-methyltransferase